MPVGQVIALIAAADEVVAASQAPSPAATAPNATTAPVPSAVTAAAAPISPVAARMVAEHGIDAGRIKPTGNRIQKEDVLAYLANHQTVVGGKVLASPKARRLAEEQGLDLTAIAGSGPDGAVLADDVISVQRAIPAVQSDQPVPPQRVIQGAASPEIVPMSRMWKVMAERLTQSWTTIPHFFLARDVDASAFKAWHVAAQTRSQIKLTYTDLLVKLVAHALRAHPRVNAAWIDGQIVANDAVHVGLAVAVEDGLLVPVVRDADTLGLGAIAAVRADLVTRAHKLASWL